MTDPNFFQINIVEIGLFIVAIAYVATYWLKGGNSATKDVINALKEQHELNVSKISDLTKQVGELTGRLDEKEKQLTLLQQLVKTTPEQELYMTEMRKFTMGVADYMASSTKTLGEISVFMHNLNNIPKQVL